mmetsp:Transcript_6878/g.15189  ORF Transcript_6878/g.15189 Transcript_6878/m.15189 type:complete len:213 (+) Transcript_6878:1096-1734(+)
MLRAWRGFSRSESRRQHLMMRLIRSWMWLSGMTERISVSCWIVSVESPTAFVTASIRDLLPWTEVLPPSSFTLRFLTTAAESCFVLTSIRLFSIHLNSRRPFFGSSPHLPVAPSSNARFIIHGPCTCPPASSASSSSSRRAFACRTSGATFRSNIPTPSACISASFLIVLCDAGCDMSSRYRPDGVASSKSMGAKPSAPQCTIDTFFNLRSG